jgi:hypothetical protein
MAYFSDRNTQTVNYSESQALFVQEMAWNVLTNYPRTRVSGIPREKADWQPPSEPTDLALAEIVNGSAQLTWNASTDNVAMAFYTVQLDGDCQETVDATSYTVTGLTNPPHIVTVRAWDTLYNYAESAPLYIPEPAVAVGFAAGALALGRMRH